MSLVVFAMVARLLGTRDHLFPTVACNKGPFVTDVSTWHWDIRKNKLRSKLAVVSAVVVIVLVVVVVGAGGCSCYL